MILSFKICLLGRKSAARHLSDSDSNIEDTNDGNSHHVGQGDGLAGIQAIMQSLSNINGMHLLYNRIYPSSI